MNPDYLDDSWYPPIPSATCKAQQQLSASRAKAIEDALGRIERMSEASPDDLRAAGWSVAAHNDYRQDGKTYSFWLVVKDGRALKGEGLTDAEALNEIRDDIREKVG